MKKIQLTNYLPQIVYGILILFISYKVLSKTRYTNETIIKGKYSNGQIKEKRSYQTKWNWLGDSKTYNTMIYTFWENGRQKEVVFLDEDGNKSSETYDSKDGNIYHRKSYIDGVKHIHLISSNFKYGRQECEYGFSDIGEPILPSYNRYDETGDLVESIDFIIDEQGNISTLFLSNDFGLSIDERKIYDYCYKIRPNQND